MLDLEEPPAAAMAALRANLFVRLPRYSGRLPKILSSEPLMAQERPTSCTMRKTAIKVCFVLSASVQCLPRLSQKEWDAGADDDMVVTDTDAGADADADADAEGKTVV